MFTWFDNDDTGRAITQRYADALSERYNVGDMSPHYEGHEDLNAAHVANKHTGESFPWKKNPSTTESIGPIGPPFRLHGN